MVRVAELDGVRICIYARDHPPPHFHVIAPKFEVMVRIADLAVLGGRAPKRILARAIEWARENREDLKLAWNLLNEDC